MSKKYERGFKHGYKTGLVVNKDLMNRDTGLRPVGMCRAENTDDVRYGCPVCFNKLSKDMNVFCHQCGQRIDWS